MTSERCTTPAGTHTLHVSRKLANRPAQLQAKRLLHLQTTTYPTAHPETPRPLDLLFISPIPPLLLALPRSWEVGLAEFPHPSDKSPSMVGQFAPTFLFASIMFQVGRG